MSDRTSDNDWHRRQRRYYRFYAAECLVWIGAGVFILRQRNEYLLNTTPMPSIWDAIFSWYGLLALCIAFFPVIYLLTFGYGLISRTFNPNVREHDIWRRSYPEARMFTPFEFPMEEHHDSATRNGAEPAGGDADPAESAPPATGALITTETAAGMALQVQKHIAERFMLLNKRSFETMEVTLRRARLSLGLGITCALLGPLVFFVWETYLSTVLHETVGHLPTLPWDRLIAEETPRIAAFAFIEVLAIFFLRNYARLTDLYRHFERIYRDREFAYLSYVLRVFHPNHGGLQQLAEELIRDLSRRDSADPPPKVDTPKRADVQREVLRWFRP
ncbi:MAG TPA: hypothetical protein VHI13_02725 [Candidatus Kapabacteria bacterium]|nr:hypothetical protein [Candidatus Kapabacteria bacterium]